MAWWRGGVVAWWRSDMVMWFCFYFIKGSRGVCVGEGRDHLFTIITLPLGTYNVAMSEEHFKEILLQHTHPPPVTGRTEASLVMMGFPQQLAGVVPSLCAWYAI